MNSPSGWYRSFANKGLLNVTTGPLSDFINVKEIEYQAICTGGVKYKVPSKTKFKGKPIRMLDKERPCVFVTSNRSLDVCPHCDYTLFWERKKRVGNG